MLALFARRPCHSRLLSLRYLTSETASATPAEAGSPAPIEEAPTSSHSLGTPTGEENYRQLISRVKSRQDAILALNILSQGRKERAVLQQHVPFTFHTSQAFIQACVAVKAFDTAHEALQRAEELGLQFYRGDAYYAVMKGAVLNKELDLAIRVFETMKENGVRPGAKVVHSLIMGSIINGRRDLAEAYAEEFRYNGVKINKASAEWLDGVRKPESGSFQDSEGADTADSAGAPSEEQEKTAAVTSA